MDGWEGLVMFVNEGYEDFCYLVSVNDNFVVLTDVPSVTAGIDSPRSIDIIYQYLNPSTITIESTTTYRSSQDFTEVDVDSSFYSRSDCPSIINCSLLLIFTALFLFNGVTRFIKKGGIVFGS